MVAKILAEHGAGTALTMTLASLASSTSGVGRQCTIISNTDLAQVIQVSVRVRTGTSPTVDKTIQLILIKGDGTYRSDGAGASDAGITIVNAKVIDVAVVDATSDKDYYLDAVIRNPGIEWGIAIVHDTGVNLNSTEANHLKRYHTEDQESQ